jgi:hypothetical protein
MKDFDLFDHRPDPTIGRLLREHLLQHDADEFAARMLAAAREAGLGRSAGRRRGLTDWSVPDGWFRPGIAAAAAVLVGALVGAQVVEHRGGATSFADAVRPAEAPSELFAAEGGVDPQLLISPLLEAQ